MFLQIVPPQIVPFTFGDDVSNAGDIVVVQCMVLKGDTPIDIKWFHNNLPVISENGLTIMRTSPRIISLNIDAVRGNHRGVYRCVATNKAGSDEYLSELNVNGT